MGIGHTIKKVCVLQIAAARSPPYRTAGSLFSSHIVARGLLPTPQTMLNCSTDPLLPCFGHFSASCVAWGGCALDVSAVPLTFVKRDLAGLQDMLTTVLVARSFMDALKVCFPAQRLRLTLLLVGQICVLR